MHSGGTWRRGPEKARHGGSGTPFKKRKSQPRGAAGLGPFVAPLAPPLRPVQVTTTTGKSGKTPDTPKRSARLSQAAQRAHRSTGEEACSEGHSFGAAKTQGQKRRPDKQTALEGSLCPIVSTVTGQRVSIYLQVQYGQRVKIRPIKDTGTKFTGHREHLEVMHGDLSQKCPHNQENRTSEEQLVDLRTVSAHRPRRP